jgi:DNA-binding beta-propeller fold protein YncE
MIRNHFIRLGLLAVISFNFSGAHVFAGDFDATTETVGRATNGFVTPVNQRVTPAGIFVELPGMRPNALALSPDGKLLITAGLTHELVAIDPLSGNILQHVPLPSDKVREPQPVTTIILDADKEAQLSFTGLKFSPDGSRIYLANVNGDIKVFSVGKDRKISPLFSISLPPADASGRKEEIPAGIAVSRDGKKLYVALNLSNRLAELDAATGKVLRFWDVGVAPFDVVLGKNKIYVSNWGGRRPETNSVTGPIGEGARVRVDARSIASEGSVTVIDLTETGGASVPASQWRPSAKTSSGASPHPQEILTGLHACALALSPNRKFLVVANAGSDTLSIIDTRMDKIVETICARQNPGDLFGAQPNALAFDKSGKKLFVCNGTQNAVAVFQFKPGESQLLGLIPVGWFPGAIAFDARDKQICVANIKQISSEMEKAKLGATGFGHNTKQYAGSLSLVPVPSKSELEKFTHIALADLRYPLLTQAKLPPRENEIARPVPERVGEPSVFQHVIYIIKENRTYDQVLGDVTEGNGDASLCNFGERVTPNEHKLVREFALLDNTYCSGILSADGHQWTVSGIATEYVERSFAGWPRSYPAGGFGLEGSDALAYSPAGFIWNDALAHGKTVADFGEFTSDEKHWKDPTRKDKITFLDAYQDFTNSSNAITYSCEPDIEALRPYMMTNTIGWDLDVPDVWRAAQFIKSLKQFEASNNFPNLIILWLPNDHTSGTDPGSPTPNAHMADNDLAMGQIFEAVSHSPYWTNTCIFAIEDDPQNGWDHVSGYRTSAYVASAYTKHHAIVSTQYNTTSLLRTMELMLGLPPMNQMDATATPMFDCFTNIPDLTAFDAVTNNVPLDELNPPAKKLSDAQLRKDAYVSARLPLDKADQCPEDVLNRILWRATMGAKPYPEWAVKFVEDDD